VFENKHTDLNPSFPQVFFVMPWSAAQQNRLAAEKSLLESYFRNRVTWIDPGHETKVEVRVTCSNNKQYTLRMYLPSDFPNSCPHLVVKTSSKLRARNGFLLEEYPGDNHLGYNRWLHRYLPFPSKFVEGRQYFVPSVHERINMAGGVRGSSSYWETFESILGRDVKPASSFQQCQL